MTSMHYSKAVFLDRDGTIIHDGHYISRPSEVVLLPHASEALALLRASGYQLFLFTNQSGVGRGMFPIESVHACNDRMLELLGLGEDLFRDICIAPETPEQAIIYRKPSPRFLDESIETHALNRDACWMVGDKRIDAEAGLNARIRAAVIRPAPLPDLLAVPQYPSLYAFAREITKSPGQQPGPEHE
jgi:D-glycero-D-manno-heptose 1,7-bisphosphate phosphatase